VTFPVKKLLEVCSVRTGKRDANHGDLGGPYRFFTCAAEPIESPTYSFDGDSIILPGNGANVGLVIFYSGKFEAYQRTYVLGEFNCDARYVYHHLKCFWSRANGSSQYGSATNYIRMGNFEDYNLPVPPLAEQRLIAEVLDRAEALRAKRRAALALIDSLPQSLFLDLFGDPKSNPKKWPCVPFAELGENQDSQRIPVKSSDRDGRKGKHPYYGASGIIDWVDDFIYEGDRLLIGEDGANLVARSTPVAYIARGQYWVNNHAHVIADNGRADLRFLEFFIEQIDLKPYISGTAQPKLNRSNLDRIAVPSPPSHCSANSPVA
jgi:type I restriction enzyme S subunit